MTTPSEELDDLIRLADEREAAMQPVDPLTQLLSRLNNGKPVTDAMRWTVILGGAAVLALVFLPSGGRRR